MRKVSRSEEFLNRLAYIVTEPYIFPSDLSKELGISYNAAYNFLARLTRKGFLIRLPLGGYACTPKGRELLSVYTKGEKV